MSRWPKDGSTLIPGVNDTWNEFQKFKNGKIVTSADWRAAKQALHKEYTAYLKQGGKPNIPSEQQDRWHISCDESGLHILIFNFIGEVLFSLTKR